jgi:hypothetical protein
MTATIGRQAAFTSWTSSELLTANMSCESMSVFESSDEFPTTPLGLGYDTYVPGLPQATASMLFRWPASGPLVGSAASALVTTGAFYEDGNDLIIGVESYTLDLAWPALETTSHSDSTAARTFLPSSMSFSGTISLRLDDTEALVNAQNASSSPLTMRFNLDSTRYFTGNVYMVGVDSSATIGQTSSQSFRFRGTGQLTAFGSGNIYAATTIGVPTVREMVATFASGRTITGDAFPSSVSITAGRNTLIGINVTAQYTGALAKA